MAKALALTALLMIFLLAAPLISNELDGIHFKAQDEPMSYPYSNPYPSPDPCLCPYPYPYPTHLSALCPCSGIYRDRPTSEH